MKVVQGDGRENKYRPYLQGVAGQAAVQGVNRLNQAHCGHIVTSIVKQNEQLTGFPSYWRWCWLNWPAGGLYWWAEPGPGRVAGAAALPGKGGQAGGAGGLVETCPALRNRWSRLRPHLGQRQSFRWS